MTSWSLTLILAGLAMLGPFATDTFLPSFPAIASHFAVSELLVQQTLSVYLFGYAFTPRHHERRYTKPRRAATSPACHTRRRVRAAGVRLVTKSWNGIMLAQLIPGLGVKESG